MLILVVVALCVVILLILLLARRGSRSMGQKEVRKRMKHLL